MLQHGVRGLQTICPSFGSIGLRSRVAKRKRGKARSKTAPEFKQNVSADGAPDKRSLADTRSIKHVGNVAGVFWHEGRSFADFGTAMPAQIGKNQPVARFERGCHGMPEFVMTRKRMEKNDWWAVAPNFVEDSGVVGAQAFHRNSVEDDSVETRLAASPLAAPVLRVAFFT